MFIPLFMIFALAGCVYVSFLILDKLVQWVNGVLSGDEDDK